MRRGVRPLRVCWTVGRVALGLSLACGMSIDLGGGQDGGMDADASGSTCSTYAPPATSAPCRACDPGSSCPLTANGCYNGFFCDIGELDCKAPGTPCSPGQADASQH